MTGNLDYEYIYQKKINRILQENSNLYGFYSFIIDQSISTVYNYLLHVKRFLNYVKDKPLTELNVDDFSGYMLKIQKNQKNGDKTTSSYKIAAYSALKKYSKYLIASNKLDKNPMDYIGRPKPIESQKTIIKRENGYLSETEILQYISTVENGVGTSKSKSHQQKWKTRDKAIIMIFLNTGIRCSALMKIDIEDIDFVNKTLTVTDKESYVNQYDLSDELLEIIQNWIDQRDVFLNGCNIDALFISNQRKRMNQASIYRVVNKYAEGIEGKHITPHKLRATYGTQLYDATKDVYFVQQCMNHSSPKTTELYIRGNGNQTKKASEIMGRLTITT